MVARGPVRAPWLGSIPSLGTLGKTLERGENMDRPPFVWKLEEGTWTCRVDGLLLGCTYWSPVTQSWWVDLETGARTLGRGDSVPTIEEAKARVKAHRDSDLWPFKNNPRVS